MKTGSSGVAARQGGGFRQGFGHFDEEHLEQQASASAVQQKQLTQQTTQSAQPTAGGSVQQPGTSQQTPTAPTAPPREVSTFKDELVKRPFQDVIKGIKAIFDINALLGIHPEDTPEEQERKKSINHRFEQLTEEQQEVAKKRYQQEMQQKKTEEEEKEKQKQLELQKKQDNVIAPPSTPAKGPIGPAGSGKQRAAQQLERDRQSIGRLQTAG